MVYYAYGDGGQSESFRVYDGNTWSTSPGSVLRQPALGRRVSMNPRTCGVDVEMTDDWGDGWDIGALKVYINDVFNELTLPNGQGPFDVAAGAGRG